jgi:hypothetical protein
MRASFGRCSDRQTRRRSGFAIQLHGLSVLKCRDSRDQDGADEPRQGRRSGVFRRFHARYSVGSFDHRPGARGIQLSRASGRRRFVQLKAFGNPHGWSGRHKAGGSPERGRGLSGWFGLDKPRQRQLLILFLVLFSVRLRTELAATTQTLEKSELLPAEKTLHTRGRSSQWARPLRGLLVVSLR